MMRLILGNDFSLSRRARLAVLDTCIVAFFLAGVCLGVLLASVFGLK